MSNSGHYWDLHVPKATKIAVAKVLGPESARIMEAELNLSAVDIDRRREEARKQCAERRARREAREAAQRKDRKP